MVIRRRETAVLTDQSVVHPVDVTVRQHYQYFLILTADGNDLTAESAAERLTSPTFDSRTDPVADIGTAGKQ